MTVSAPNGYDRHCDLCSRQAYTALNELFQEGFGITWSETKRVHSIRPSIPSALVALLIRAAFSRLATRVKVICRFTAFVRSYPYEA